MCKVLTYIKFVANLRFVAITYSLKAFIELETFKTKGRSLLPFIHVELKASFQFYFVLVKSYFLGASSTNICVVAKHKRLYREWPKANTKAAREPTFYIGPQLGLCHVQYSMQPSSEQLGGEHWTHNQDAKSKASIGGASSRVRAFFRLLQVFFHHLDQLAVLGRLHANQNWRQE